MTKILDLTKLESKEDREIKEQNKERLCYCCDTLQESTEMIRTLKINRHDRGFGSDLENDEIKVQLCPNCYKKEYEKWFNEIPVIDDHFEVYQHEEDISKLIKSLPLENQEYITNNNGEIIMERQDWIDMKNETLSDEEYTKYGMYSPSEIESYKERFPTCHYPMNITYEDDSKGCRCMFGASGEYNQETDENISDACHNCEHYKARESKILTVNNEDFELFRQWVIGESAKAELSKKMGKPL